MSDRSDYLEGTPADFVFEGPSDDVLRQMMEHESGDLTLRGPGGEARLVKGSSEWRRYRGYLDALDGEDPTCADSVGPRTFEEAKRRGLDRPPFNFTPEDFVDPEA